MKICQKKKIETRAEMPEDPLLLSNMRKFIYIFLVRILCGKMQSGMFFDRIILGDCSMPGEGPAGDSILEERGG